MTVPALSNNVVVPELSFVLVPARAVLCLFQRLKMCLFQRCHLCLFQRTNFVGSKRTYIVYISREEQTEYISAVGVCGGKQSICCG